MNNITILNCKDTIFFLITKKVVILQSEKWMQLYRWQPFKGLREESPGNIESPYFLTGRDVAPKCYATASATETIPPVSTGKGANAR